MNKTIRSTLKKYDKETRLKVGSSEGTSFWYMGTVGDFLKNLNKYNDATFRYAQNKKKRAEAKLDQMIKSWPTPESYVRKQFTFGGNSEVKFESYQAELKFWFDGVTRKKKTLNNATKELLSYVTLGRRTVIDVFMQNPAADDEGLVMNVEGYETGIYWLYSEAEKLPVIGFVSDKPEDNEDDKQDVC